MRESWGRYVEAARAAERWLDEHPGMTGDERQDFQDLVRGYREAKERDREDLERRDAFGPLLCGAGAVGACREAELPGERVVFGRHRTSRGRFPAPHRTLGPALLLAMRCDSGRLSLAQRGLRPDLEGQRRDRHPGENACG